MKDQINTIRKALTFYSVLDADAKEALAALTQLEAMVGEQEPVYWHCAADGLFYSPRRAKFLNVDISTCTALYAAPVAHQYEAGDMASAAAQGFRDGVASVAQQPQYKCRACGTHEVAVKVECQNSRCDAYAYEDTIHEGWKAQQPQAEAVRWPAGSASLHVQLLNIGKHMAKERSREIGDAWNQLADLLALLAKAREAPQQAEAVPPGYALVPLEPTQEMLYAMHTESLTFYEDEQREAYRAMINAAIAQQKGGV